MESHPVDPVALVGGLFLGLSGLAILADRQWDDVDVAAFTAAGVVLIGLLLAGLVVVRSLVPTMPPDPDPPIASPPTPEPSADTAPPADP